MGSILSGVWTGSHFAAAAVGVLLGGLLTAALAVMSSRRYVRKVRAAERRARAAERMAEIGSLTGGLAHEIKNPLSTIGLNAQLLAEGVEELDIDADRKGRLSRRIAALRREVERLRGVLTDFLSFAGNIKPEARAIDVRRSVEEIADFFMPQAVQSGVTLRVDMPGEPVMCLADAALFKQAMLNLMLNAVQAMTNAGAAGGAKELIIRVSEGKDDAGHPSVCIHVIDTGPGIPGEALERIFQPYFTTKAGGSGLGLPTARRLIEAQEGRLEVVTEPGRGTDFVIMLPVAGDQTARGGSPRGGA